MEDEVGEKMLKEIAVITAVKIKDKILRAIVLAGDILITYGYKTREHEDWDSAVTTLSLKVYDLIESDKKPEVEKMIFDKMVKALHIADEMQDEAHKTLTIRNRHPLACVTLAIKIYDEM